jgi:hypothetical protein
LCRLRRGYRCVAAITHACVLYFANGDITAHSAATARSAITARSASHHLAQRATLPLLAAISSMPWEGFKGLFFRLMVRG